MANTEFTQLELSDGSLADVRDGKAMPKNGGTFTGNISGQYGAFTRLQSTAREHLTPKSDQICVFDGSGWIYYKTLSELKADLGAVGTTSAQITLSASGWVGTEAPYQYDLGAAYDDKTVTIGFDSSKGTEEQLDAVCDAFIQGGSGTILYAWGDKPTADIPAIITYT